MSRPARPTSANSRLPPYDRQRNTGAVQTVQLLDVTPHEIVALKPAGLASELPRDPAADSLVHRLGAQGFSGLRLVHRLDALSCGLMLVARSAEAAAYYAQEIAARRWHKWYVAQVALPLAKAEQLVGAHKSYLKVDGASARVVRAGGKPSFFLGRWNDQLNFNTPSLSNSLWLGAGQFKARVYGANGVTNIVEASSDFNTWMPIATNSVGIFDFIDAAAGGYSNRFYRARLAQ